jgi:1-deoxy-D-xylulose-5-phosphate reductoisomerase
MSAAAPCVLNAANEIAVGAFLDQGLAFLDIARVNETVLEALGHSEAPVSIEAVVALDEAARVRAKRVVQGLLA